MIWTLTPGGPAKERHHKARRPAHAAAPRPGPWRPLVHTPSRNSPSPLGKRQGLVTLSDPTPLPRAEPRSPGAMMPPGLSLPLPRDPQLRNLASLLAKGPGQAWTPGATPWEGWSWLPLESCRSPNRPTSPKSDFLHTPHAPVA